MATLGDLGPSGAAKVEIMGPGESLSVASSAGTEGEKLDPEKRAIVSSQNHHPPL